ncbi:hypothetical protein HO133_010860 [Letharia lupina]|uniref:Uncharacterized protein n=1 Tax=Letharia lupina TaxID=560253 RepID=A0A8H6FDF6_9LECA|nr:uncharacterized protein HO133_010860 [Letharia lupina]KAF6224285.1 hypothetical protein HO133_010860 [Letharia lupina]
MNGFSWGDDGAGEEGSADDDDDDAGRENRMEQVAVGMGLSLGSVFQKADEEGNMTGCDCFDIAARWFEDCFV